MIATNGINFFIAGPLKIYIHMLRRKIMLTLHIMLRFMYTDPNLVLIFTVCLGVFLVCFYALSCNFFSFALLRKLFKLPSV